MIIVSIQTDKQYIGEVEDGEAFDGKWIKLEKAGMLIPVVKDGEIVDSQVIALDHQGIFKSEIWIRNGDMIRDIKFVGENGTLYAQYRAAVSPLDVIRKGGIEIVH